MEEAWEQTIVYFDSAHPPPGYERIGATCRCVNLWKDELGNSYCRHCRADTNIAQTFVEDVARIKNQIEEGKPRRRYLPTLADLVDRLTIVNQKAIFIPEHREKFLQERADILHDIELVLKESPPLTARAILAITMIQLTNRYIWENESKAREGQGQDFRLLRMTHSVNGIRNASKNLLSEEVGGRKDYKIDCFASDLIEEFGNWNVLSVGE